MSTRNKSQQVSITVALPAFLQSSHLLLEELKVRMGLDKVLLSASRSLGPLSDAMLFSLLTGDKDLSPPYAALTAMGFGFEADKAWWLKLDPIELLVDAGNICLVGRDHLLLTPSETRQLLLSLNEHLKDDGLFIQAGSTQEWLINLEHPQKIETHPLHEVVSKDIRPFLPKGENNRWWHRLVTEFQMLLFQHDVNSERLNQKMPLVNSVWLWGEGKLSGNYALNKFQGIWSDNSLIRGMVYLSEERLDLLPSNQFALANVEQPGDYLLTWDHYQHGLEPLLEILINLLKLLEERQIQHLSLHLGSGHIYTWQAPRKRFFGLEKFF